MSQRRDRAEMTDHRSHGADGGGGGELEEYGAGAVVEVGPGATVLGFTWVTDPSVKHPFSHPFAFALLQIDGTDVPMVHAVDAGSPDALSVGDKVTAQYRDDRRGAITDAIEAKASA